MISEPVYMPSGHWQQPGMIPGQQWGYPEPQHTTNHVYSNGVNHQQHLYSPSLPYTAQFTPTGMGHQNIYLRGLGMESSRPLPDRNGYQNGHAYPPSGYQPFHSGYAGGPQILHQPKQPPNMAYPYGVHTHFPSGPAMNGTHVDYSHPATPLTPMSGPSPHSSSLVPFPPSPLLSRRGPPRKPKRSGHAVWVGNIPLGASIEALKDHFSRDATNEIESVFLMSKSNCAFVNYRTKEACEAAVERFNHSLFGSVRLLCRLRRDTQNRSRDEESTSPAPAPPSSDRSDSVLESNNDVDGLSEQIAGLDIDQAHHPEQVDGENTTPPRHLQDRYFILKSLTKEDLNESLQKGTWETQPHNQTLLDSAFREAQRSGKNVFLIFSVNKSGEYFGFARMIGSPFDIKSQPSSSSMASSHGERHVEGLRIHKTPATSTAPKGQIVDDQARGTLFWEAQRRASASSSSSPPDADDNFLDNERSRPFQIEWQSVRRVTFQRTKGMKNSWNSGKDVKVARDGTEIETEVGKKILELFFEDVGGRGDSSIVDGTNGLGRR
ncbi:YTH domain-containing protein ECT1, partial [Pseudocercospora fuligena]